MKEAIIVKNKDNDTTVEPMVSVPARITTKATQVKENGGYHENKVKAIFIILNRLVVVTAHACGFKKDVAFSGVGCVRCGLCLSCYKGVIWNVTLKKKQSSNLEYANFPNETQNQARKQIIFF